MINAFPNRSEKSIEDELSNLPDLSDYQGLSQIYFNLARPSTQRFLDALVSSCLQLQGNRIYKTASEDERNTFIASILEASGNSIKDQTRWSTSHAGLSAGEIDIFVSELDGKPFAVIEALNLDSLRKDYIELHIDKIFKYDTSGLPQNFILVYSTATNFTTLWEKYIEFISNHSYNYDFVKFETVTDYKFAELKIGKAEHLRNNEKIFLYHLMINLNLP